MFHYSVVWQKRENLNRKSFRFADFPMKIMRFSCNLSQKPTNWDMTGNCEVLWSVVTCCELCCEDITSNIDLDLFQIFPLMIFELEIQHVYLFEHRQDFPNKLPWSSPPVDPHSMELIVSAIRLVSYFFVWKWETSMIHRLHWFLINLPTLYLQTTPNINLGISHYIS